MVKWSSSRLSFIKSWVRIPGTAFFFLQDFKVVYSNCWSTRLAKRNQQIISWKTNISRILEAGFIFSSTKRTFFENESRNGQHGRRHQGLPYVSRLRNGRLFIRCPRPLASQLRHGSSTSERTTNPSHRILRKFLMPVFQELRKECRNNRI